MIRIGVDFGGTKIEAAALDGDGQYLARVRRPNPGNYDAALVAVRELVEEAEAKTDRVDRIGIGIPGSVSPKTGKVRNANSVYLNGHPFREDLETALGRPVRLANDADCLALSEATDGAGAGFGVVFAVIVGTGCGGGLAVNGRPIGGTNGIAGEWGHNPLPWPKADEQPPLICWCGKHGCQELYLSGTGFTADYRRCYGGELNGPAIVAAMRAGDANAKATFDRYVDRLGRGLAVVVNLIDPDVIVLGGGMSNVDEIYPALPAIITERIFSDMFETPIRKAVHGDSSGVRGAAWLWPVE
jgi:fructokinase